MTVNELVTNFFERVYNQKEFAYVLEIFSESYHEHTETGARSNRDCQEIIKGACSVFPDLKVEINEVIARGSLAAARVTFTGTHQAEFFGIPATGKTISFEAMEFFRAADGVITESWGSWPIYGMLKDMQG